MSDVSVSKMSPKQRKFFFFFLAIGALLDFVRAFWVPLMLATLMLGAALIWAGGLHPLWGVVMLLAMTVFIQHVRLKEQRSAYEARLSAQSTLIGVLSKDYKPRRVRRIPGFTPSDQD